MKRASVVLFGVLLLFSPRLNAQCGYPTMDNLDDMLMIYANLSDSTGAADAEHDIEMLMSGYLNPFMWIISHTSTNNWYNTAETHELMGFDVNIGVSLVWTPSKFNEFLVNDTTLKRVNVTFPKKLDSAYLISSVPTVMGDMFTTPNFQTKDNRYSYNGLPGTSLKRRFGFGAIPMPVVQGGVGMPQNTDLKFKFTPPLTYGNGTVLLYMAGIGAMHNLSQYFGSIGDLDELMVSGFAGYTNFFMRTRLSDKNLIPSQKGKFNFHSVTAQLVASNPISVVTIYGGIGITYTNMRFRILGEYNTDFDITTFELKDPVDFRDHLFFPKGTLGARAGFGAITINADYSYQRFHALNMGLGFTFN